MRARNLREKVTIQTPTRTANSYGEPIEAFSTYCTRYAEIRTATGREVFNGTQEVNDYPVMFRIRYDDLTKNVTEKMRILYKSKYYDIESIINFNEQNKEIHIYGKNRGT